MSTIVLVAAGEAIARRRAALPPGRVIEAWPDVVIPGRFWLDEESRALLDDGAERVAVELAIDADRVPVYYGPRLTDVESLPPLASLRARVLSAHGIAAAWITLDRFGRRVSYEPQAPTDPIFHLRRRGGGAGHLWRLFRARAEAIAYMIEAYGDESEAAEWARGLPIADFEELIRAHGAAT